MIERCSQHQDVGPPALWPDVPQSDSLNARLMDDARWIANHEQESLPEEVPS